MNCSISFLFLADTVWSSAAVTNHLQGFEGLKYLDQPVWEKQLCTYCYDFVVKYHSALYKV